MKVTSTLMMGMLCLILTFSYSSSFSQCGNCNGNSGNGNGNTPVNVSFTATPTLISGTALTVGAKYKFLTVEAGTNAIVTIMSAVGGATVAMLDDNNLTKPEAFSPAINIPANSNGLVEFKIEFQKTNGNAQTVSQVTATAMDIDGNATLKEVDVIDMGAGSTAAYVAVNTEISMVQTGTAWKGTNVAGVEYTAVDTMAKQVMFTVTKANVSSFTYKAGANNTATSAVNARQKGIYFKGFNYPLTIVPVKYISFTGKAVNTAAVLDWVSVESFDHSYYEVESSYNGNNFSTVGLILDGFENGLQKTYSFKDNDASSKGQTVAYYRLKQFDLDGKFAYSNIVAVRFSNENEFAMVVSPNPFTEEITVNFSSKNSGKAELRLLDITGKSILTQSTTVVNGNNIIRINGLTQLRPGVYTAALVADGKLLATRKIIK